MLKAPDKTADEVLTYLEMNYPDKAMGEAARDRWRASIMAIGASSKEWQLALPQVLKECKSWPSLQKLRSLLEQKNRSDREEEFWNRVYEHIREHGRDYLAMGCIPSESVCEKRPNEGEAHIAGAWMDGPGCVSIYVPRGVPRDSVLLRHRHLGLAELEADRALDLACDLSSRYDGSEGSWTKREDLYHPLKSHITRLKTRDYREWELRCARRYKLAAQNALRSKGWSDDEMRRMAFEEYQPDLGGWSPEADRREEAEALRICWPTPMAGAVR